MFYLRIDSKDDLEWLRKVVTNLLNGDPNNPKFQTNYPHIAAWDNYLENNLVTAKDAVESVGEEILSSDDQEKIAIRKAKELKIQKEKERIAAAKAAGKKVYAPRKSKETPDPFKCPEHATYEAKRRPRKDCSGCWNLYQKFHPLEYAKARDEFERRQKV